MLYPDQKNKDLKHWLPWLDPATTATSIRKGRIYAKAVVQSSQYAWGYLVLSQTRILHVHNKKLLPFQFDTIVLNWLCCEKTIHQAGVQSERMGLLSQTKILQETKNNYPSSFDPIVLSLIDWVVRWNLPNMDNSGSKYGFRNCHFSCG